MVYQSLFFHKTLNNQTPVYLYKKNTAGGSYPYKTRQAATCPPGFSFEVLHPTARGKVRPEPVSRLGLSRQGWCLRSTELYKTLPPELRLEIKIPSFNKRLKKWIEVNISIQHFKNFLLKSNCNLFTSTLNC